MAAGLGQERLDDRLQPCVVGAVELRLGDEVARPGLGRNERESPCGTTDIARDQHRAGSFQSCCGPSVVVDRRVTWVSVTTSGASRAVGASASHRRCLAELPTACRALQFIAQVRRPMTKVRSGYAFFGGRPAVGRAKPYHATGLRSTSPDPELGGMRSLATPSLALMFGSDCLHATGTGIESNRTVLSCAAWHRND